MTLAATTTHPWIGSLQAELDALEAALLRGDAPGVEQASAALQAVLQQAPAAAGPDATLQQDTQSAAQRFARLRQAVLRANAQNQRALTSLLPQQAMQQQPTYGRMVKPSTTGGAGRGFLTA
ncbi:MAG: hypothetical protein K5880_22510 [Hydrogenophaga sp.]|jgi:hypothetical protein|uniref:hypothetical protein n=1 Tax=Hydrogenophaga sp. TaxID=1904254 RepID=UPI00260DCF85|nr:hypothetical protein [Hydrogenophaga sp.]MCV0441377.1 hypothetical protein [Hydrogenophaga sp.]